MFKCFVLLMLWTVCSAYWDGTQSTCKQEAIYKSHLDLAIKLIKIAKDNHNVPANRFPKALDCADVFEMGGRKSGIYEIRPVSRVTEGKKPLNVYCDMDTSGGGWTVIQRRGAFQNPNDFYQDWKRYKKGFGDIDRDFWLGNDNIYALTNQKFYQVRFDLKDVDQNKRYALYDTFWIDDENHKYTIHILDFCGNAGDSMAVHHNQAFSTKDKDNDRLEENHCAVTFKGGWWYNGCYFVDLNGEAVIWHGFKGLNESLEWTEIKIRPKYFTAPTSGITCHKFTRSFTVGG